MKAQIFRQEFANLPRGVNWYPGHMRKTMRNLGDDLKKVNMFIEVRDARIPMTSHNPELIKLVPPQMRKIVVYNKIDLANVRKTTELLKRMDSDEKTIASFTMSTKENVNVNKLVKLLAQHCPAEFRTVGAWVMIGGMPNLGKSTIINSLR